jgi:hypothetical protein
MSSPANDKVTTRKPTLPEKYGKFIQFAYYMMDNVLGESFQMDKEAFLEKIKVFGSVEEQQVLVQNFMNNAKENKKTIRKAISDRKKAIAKANKPVRQPRAKKADAVTEETGAPVTKRPRKKASKEVNNGQDELLNELVQLAREEVPIAKEAPASEPVAEEPVAAKKPAKTAAAKKTKKAAEPVA